MLIAMLNFHKYHICHHSDSDFRNQLCTYAQLGFAGECSTTQLWRCLGKNIPSHRIHVLRVYLHFGTKLMGQMQVDIFTSPMDTLKIFMHLKIGFECPFPHDHLLSETFRLQKENQTQSESKNFIYIRYRCI